MQKSYSISACQNLVTRKARNNNIKGREICPFILGLTTVKNYGIISTELADGSLQEYGRKVPAVSSAF